MARRLPTVAHINAYVAAVTTAATHHAPNVEHAIGPLARAVVQRLNLPIDNVSVYERNGQLARTCWVTIGGNRYVFTYNYSSHEIDLRQHSTQGQLLFSFDNATTLAAITAQAKAL